MAALSSLALLSSLLRLRLLSLVPSPVGRSAASSLTLLLSASISLLLRLSSSFPRLSPLLSLLEAFLELCNLSSRLLRRLSSPPSILSLILKSRTLSTSLRSSSSTLLSLKLFSLSSTFTNTSSPILYFFSSSSFSSSVLPFSGFAATNISRSVFTVALCLVSLTGALHDGQVYGVPPAGIGVAFGVFRDEASWKENHSFRQEPQKVCRQSRSVRG
jgi:hypothetical protein